MKTYTVKSNATRAMKKLYPDRDDCTVELARDHLRGHEGDGWVICVPVHGTSPGTTALKHAKKLQNMQSDAKLANGTGLHETFVRAYNHFNSTLFENRLPECMIIVHRKKNARGYFWAEQWKNRNTKEGRHEIAMNPDSFGVRSSKDILSTLVHEMTHLEQEIEGKPGKRGYHNKEWVGLMKRVGLVPYAADAMGFPIVDNGRLVTPEKMKDTGTKVTHMVAPGEAFDVACDGFLAHGYEIAWTTHEPSAAERAVAKVKRASKTKFTCPECSLNAWAKPDAAVGCWSCGVEMEDEA